MATHSPIQTTVKFLCSFGGKIIPRYPDGNLRYHGGQSRVLSVSRSVTFAELTSKLGEICGITARLRCQLPTDDLDALVTITSDEDLTNLMEEYDLVTAAPPLKIRAFLSPLKSTATSSSPPDSTANSSSSSSSKSSSRSRSPPSLSPGVNQETCQIRVERSMRNNGCYIHRTQSHNQLYHQQLN